MILFFKRSKYKMETIRFVLAVPSLYRNDDVWYKFVKYNWPNLEKNKKDFQN